jgi:dTDP-4-dehydrorhamnose reductase
LDLTKPAAAEELLSDFAADIVLHAAAMSRVLQCEAQPAQAESVNVDATAALIKQAASKGARVLFFSTDMVFAGDTGYYTERHRPSPKNVYGRTKLRAEKSVLEASPRNLVMRLNSVVGAAQGWGSSFTERVLSEISKVGRVQLFSDQFRSPIHVRSVVAVVSSLVEREMSGVLHVGGPQRLSRVELGRALCRAVKIDEGTIVENSYLTHPQAALMPCDTSFGRGRREVELPELDIRPVEVELAADYREERILP